MRIQHNIMAMNAYRNYNTNTSALSKNLEKLSSGYKINRAGDDAAGLAISEKMRAQITGLNAAQKNVKDGISLVKTAEGAMQEIQDMLNRMDYLATQSANGTYDNEVDRLNLQKEVNQLRSEINRIADSANFNGIKLLDGSQSGINTAAFAVTSTDATEAVAGAEVDLSNKITSESDVNNTANVDGHLGKEGSAKVDPSFTVDLSDVSFDVAKGATGSIAISFAGVSVTATGLAAGATADKTFTASDIASAVATNATVSIGGKTFSVTTDGNSLKFALASGQSVANSTDVTSINTALANGAVTLTGTGATLTGGTNHVHNLQNVNMAALEVKGSKAGISLTLDGDVVKDGQTLKIDDKEYVFKTDKDSTVQAGSGQTLIDVSAIEGTNDADTTAKQVAEAARLIAKDANTTTNFQISVNGSKIHVDQKDSSTTVYDTYDKLKEVFSVTGAGTPAANATTNIAITSNSIKDGDKLTIAGKTYTFVKESPNASNNEIAISNAVDGLESALQGEGYTVTKNGTTLKISSATAGAAAPTVKTTAGLTLQIGDTSDSYNQLQVKVGDMHVRSMGTMDANGNVVTGKSIADIDISNPEGASAAINVIRNAINYVSGIRGDLGATQNRLEHTANNLSVMAENIQDAESTIRDTDVAEEMMAYTKNNILVQSAQAMLAQANAVPQGVLQLLG